jgi:uncharacterized repeat protein (TIGR01451 family)
VYQNTGSGFSEVYNLTGVFDGSVAWGDYDDDGDLDILLTGEENSYDPISKIYRNDDCLPDLDIAKSVDPLAAAPGDTITYTLGFSNVGTLTATNVVVTDSIPVSVTNTAVVSTGDVTITLRGGTHYVWDVGDLAPGEGGVITITGVLSQGLAAGSFTNTATIATTSVEANTANNSDGAGVTVQNVAPVLAPIGDQVVDEETELAFTATADDANGDTLTYSLQGAPTGAMIDGGSGAFSWTPGEAQGPGAYQVTVVVSDSVITDSETITITVNEVNVAPVLAPIGDQVVDEGTELAFTATADDDDVPAQTLSYGLQGAPSGATIDGGSGAFSWTPGEAQGPGVYQVTVVVSDTLVTDSETITITVNEVNVAPTILDIADQSTTAGTPLTVTFTIGDVETAPDTLTLTADSSNTALVMVSAITLEGSGTERTATITPTDGVVGTTIITITVDDGEDTTYGTFVLTVESHRVYLPLVLRDHSASALAHRSSGETTYNPPVPYQAGARVGAGRSQMHDALARLAAVMEPAGSASFLDAGMDEERGIHDRTSAIPPVRDGRARSRELNESAPAEYVRLDGGIYDACFRIWDERS